MTAATVRASDSGITLDAGTTLTITLPGSPVAGDHVGIWLTDASARIASQPSGWTLDYSVAFGSASRTMLHREYVSGSSVVITVGSGGYSIAWVVVVLDGSVHSGFGSLGTVTTRGGSATTTTAAATGDTAAPNLVISHEKASTHTSAPTVSPATTTIQNQHTNNASDPAVYVGAYDTAGGTSSRTITYSTASANGAALQLPVPLVPVSTPARTFRRNLSGGYRRTGIPTRTLTTTGYGRA